MAIFALSKELRALSVVEFVVLLASMVLSCSFKSETNGEDSTPRSVNLFQKARDLAFSMLEFGIFIAVLVLLLRDLRVCDDALPNRSIYVAFAGIALSIATRVAALIMPHIWPEPRANSDVENGHAMENVAKAASRLFKGLSGALDCVSNFAVREGTRKFLFVLLPTAMVVAGLGLAAMVVFFIATTIKIAIPEDYETVCEPNAGIARTIMVVLPYLYAVPSALVFIFVMGPNFSRVTGTKIAVVVLFVQVMAFVVAGIMTLILFVRFLKVWRGEDPMLYEYVAFAIGPPLFKVIPL